MLSDAEKHSHEGTAEEADTEHEHPAGDGANAVNKVTKGQSEVVLGDPTVGRVESALVSRNLLIVLLGVDLVKLFRCHGGGVHIDDMKGSRKALLVSGLGLGNLVVPDGGSTGRPGGAKNTLRLAVQHAKVGGGRVGGEEEDGFLDGLAREGSIMMVTVVGKGSIEIVMAAYIECLLGALATTEASLVATSNKDQPIFLLLTGSQDGLPVLKGHRSDALLGDLLGQLLDGISRDSRGHVGLGLVEPSLNTVGQRKLLLCQSEGREEGDKRSETHFDGCDALVVA